MCLGIRHRARVIRTDIQHGRRTAEGRGLLSDHLLDRPPVALVPGRVVEHPVVPSVHLPDQTSHVFRVVMGRGMEGRVQGER